TLPKTLHITELTPHVDWSSGAARPVAETTPWPETGRPRRAGISSFGMSGTNAHLIVEQAPEAPEVPEVPALEAPAVDGTAAPAPGVVPWLLSGRSAEALRAQARQLLTHLEAVPDAPDGDVAHALATTRAVFEHRAVVVAADRQQACAGLAALAADGPAPMLTQGLAASGHQPVFVFPGQGSQWAGMALELLESSAVFRERMRECAEALAPYTGWDVFDLLHGKDGATMDTADTVQPALFAVMVSLAAVWRAYGVEPAAVIGHSQGEIAAACVAGALTLEDAACVVALRSQVLDALRGRGGMLSVPLPQAEVAELLQHWDGRLSVAAVNGPRSTVVSGDTDALHELHQRCTERDVRSKVIPVDYASHCAQVEDVRERLAEVLASVSARPADIPFYSTVTAGGTDTTGLDSDYWFRNLRGTVRFEETVRALVADGHHTFIEISPHPVLTTSLRETVEELDIRGGATVLSTLRRDEGGPARLLSSLAEAHVRGLPVNWTAVWPRGPRSACDLPTYPFQRSRHWVRPAAHRTEPAQLGLRTAGHPLLGAALPLADGAGLVLTGSLSRTTLPWLADHQVAGTTLLPGTAFLELALHAAEEAGCPGVEELTVLAPLTLSDETADVQLTVGAPDEDGLRPFQIHSRPGKADADQPWTRHATGTLGTADRAISERTEQALTEWPPPGGVPVALDGHYATLASLGYEYGPAFQGLSAAWRAGEDLYAEVAPAEELAEADTSGLHPALLDAALHALGLDAAEAQDGVRLPFAWHGARLYARGARALRVRLRPAGADAVALTVCDPAGQPVVSVESLVLRTVEPGRLAGGPDTSDAMYRVEWTAVSEPSGSPELSGDDSRWAVVDSPALADALGAESCATLREAADSVPHVVVVEGLAYGDGDLTPATHEATHRALGLMQEWLADERFASSKLVFLTRDAVAAAPGDRIGDLPHSAVWGLLRTAQSEHPGRIVVIDLDGKGEVYGKVRAAVAAGEPQLAVRYGELSASRLVRATVSESLELPSGAWRLENTAKGTLENL
ncbi:acyltransferase domain-containing protein, partial [Streptomyces monomycini]